MEKLTRCEKETQAHLYREGLSTGRLVVIAVLIPLEMLASFFAAQSTLHAKATPTDQKGLHAPK